MPKPKFVLERSIWDDSETESRLARRSRSDVDIKILDEDLQKCYDIVAFMYDKDVAYPFREPVNWVELGIPSYPTIVKNPMDLGTIISRLLSGEISTISKFAEYMRLTFKNSIKFNEVGSEMRALAFDLLEEFEAHFNNLSQEHLKNTSLTASTMVPMDTDESPSDSKSSLYSELETTISELEARKTEIQSQIDSLKASYLQQAEEKAQASQPLVRFQSFKCIPPRQPFTYDEKRALCQRIESLREDDIPGLLEVISANYDAAESLEVDIESLPDATLFKVKDYVDSVTGVMKKKLSKVYDSDDDYEDYRRKLKRTDRR